MLIAAFLADRSGLALMFYRNAFGSLVVGLLVCFETVGRIFLC